MGYLHNAVGMTRTRTDNTQFVVIFLMSLANYSYANFNYANFSYGKETCFVPAQFAMDQPF